jgi:hypothetical protein
MVEKNAAGRKYLQDNGVALDQKSGFERVYHVE